MKIVPSNFCTYTAAVLTVLVTGCSFSTSPRPLLGPPYVRNASSASRKTPTARSSHRVRAFGGWTPTYYHGRLMFYDDMGQPFFYSGSTRVFMSTTSPQYSVACDHWRDNQYAYDRWHAVYHKPRYRRARR